MFADGLFWHRLYAETARYLLQHPGVRHWQAVVLTPRADMPLGPVELFAEFLERRVTIVNPEKLSQRRDLEPLEDLLTLVVRPEVELGPTSQQLLGMKPELSTHDRHYLVEAATKSLAGGDHGDRRNPTR